MKEIYEPLMEEKATEEQYSVINADRLYTEEEVMQEDIFARMPGFITLLKKYELRPLLKIIGAIALMVAVYLVIGWDAVAAGIALYIFMFGITYIILSKNQTRDSTMFVETKLPGQKIPMGDHSLYNKEFYTTEKRFALWEVPNTLLRRGIFKMPGEQNPSLMPGTDRVIFVDLFDRINRTCVLPRDMDVANIAFVTNANPMLARRLETIGNQIKYDKRMERLIKDMYSAGHLGAVEAKNLLEPIVISQRTLMSPTNETRRDIFFDLQAVIPDLRKRLQKTVNQVFLLADFWAAQGIYQSTNRPMPEQIRKNHNFIYGLYGLPQIPGMGSKLGDD